MLKTAPGPKGYPLIGVIPFMVKHGADYLLSAFQEYGDVVRLKLLGPLQMFLISHPEHVEYVLQKNQRNFIVKRPSLHLTAMMGNGLTLSNGDLWLRQRRLMQPAFHRQKIEGLAAITAQRIAETIQRWETGGQIDIASAMEQLSLNALLGAMFGTSIDPEAARRITHAVEFVLGVAGRGMFLEVPPAIPTPENLRVREALRDLRQVILGLIEQRRGSQDGQSNQDLLSLLLDSQSSESPGMSEQQLYDEVTAVLVAGYETTAVTMTWMFYLIAQHPEVAQRLREEIAAVVGERPVSFADLPELKYANMVINESMRCYAPFWAITRETVADDQIGGYAIPAKSLIAVSPYVTHKHPEFWTEPDKFDPDRFSPEGSANRHRFAYYPFGAGPRICIGERQAMLILQLSLATILQNYHLELIPEHPIQIHTAMTIRPKYGMLMNVTPVRATA